MGETELLQNNSKPLIGEFEIYARRIAAGEALSLEEFSTFLSEGLDFWSNRTKKDPTNLTAEELAKKYAQALYGDTDEKANFCIEEASNLEVEARRMRGSRVRDAEGRACRLEESAGNWKKMADSLSKTKRE
jgi:hypothetical protein